MKKILILGTVFAAVSSINANAMSGYGYGGMPQQSAYGYGGMPQQSAYGMQQQSAYGYGGMPQQSAYGMQQQGGYGYGGMQQQRPQSQVLPATTSSAGAGALTQDVKNAILEKVMNNTAIAADIKGEAAYAVAFGVALNEAIICVTRSQNGTLFRLHSNPRNNGIVTDPGEIQNFNDMFTKAQSGGGTVTIQSSIVSNGKPETFIFDVLAIDANHIVIVRHK